MDTRGLFILTLVLNGLGLIAPCEDTDWHGTDFVTHVRHMGNSLPVP